MSICDTVLVIWRLLGLFGGLLGQLQELLRQSEGLLGLFERLLVQFEGQLWQFEELLGQVERPSNLWVW